MLDLKKLEQDLDNALNNETEESLRDWLDSMHNAELNEYIGDGILQSLKSCNFSFEILSESDTMFSSTDCCVNISTIGLSKAA